MTVGFSRSISFVLLLNFKEKVSFVPLFFYKFSKTVSFILLQDFNESVLLGHEISMTVGFSMSVVFLL